jgi:hypothetical protein
VKEVQVLIAVTPQPISSIDERSIRAGVTPTLKAARTAFAWPRVNFGAVRFAADELECGVCLVSGTDAAAGVFVEGPSTTGIGLPRRLHS